MTASNARLVAAFHFLHNCLSGARVALRWTIAGAIVQSRVQSAQPVQRWKEERPQPAAGRKLHNPPPFTNIQGMT